jgi:uncharacterized membrane protein
MPTTWNAAGALAADAPAIRRLRLSDIPAALKEGWDDFMAMPTQLIFLCLIYPLVGFVLARAASRADWLSLIYPLLAGFALLGPVFAIGLYELSRRRERGEAPRWTDMFKVLSSPGLFPMMALSAVLLAVFVAWIATAKAIYTGVMGHEAPESIWAMLHQVMTSPEGTTLILVGNAVGALFALAAFALSVLSFPMLLDRDGGLRRAVSTSLRAIAANPVPMLAWGVTVAVLLALGFATLMVGLAVVLPVLGHATWHLYRRAVA